MKHIATLLIFICAMVSSIAAQELDANMETIRAQDRDVQATKANRGTKFFWIDHITGTTYNLNNMMVSLFAGEIGAGWFPLNRVALCMTFDVVNSARATGSDGDNYWYVLRYNSACLSARLYLFRGAGFFIEGGAVAESSHKISNLRNSSHNYIFLSPQFAIGCEYLFTTGGDFINEHLGMMLKLSLSIHESFFAIGLSYRL